MEDHQTTPISARTLLSEIQSLVQKHRTADALEQALILESSLPKNIFVAGLQKQIEKLLKAENTDSSDASALRNSLQPLIDRAFESTKGAPVQHAISQTLRPATKSDRAKAIDGLKAQYLGHADTMMKKGDYENALAEVRRILLLDPNDGTAPSYIHRLEELVLLEKEKKVTQNLAMANTRRSEPAEKKFAPSASLDELVTMTKPEFDSIIAKTSNAKLPAPAHDATPTNPKGQRTAERAGTPKRKFTSFLFGSAFFIILAIAASYFITSQQPPEATGVEQKIEATKAVPATNKLITAETSGEIQTTDKGTSLAATTKDSLQSTN